MVWTRTLLVSDFAVDIETENFICFSKRLPVFTNDLPLLVYLITSQNCSSMSVYKTSPGRQAACPDSRGRNI